MQTRWEKCYIGMTNHCSQNVDAIFLLQLSMVIVTPGTMPAM